MCTTVSMEMEPLLADNVNSAWLEELQGYFQNRDLEGFCNTLDSLGKTKEFCEHMIGGQQNYLHLACDHEDQTFATNFVKKILNRVVGTPSCNDFRFKFVNQEEHLDSECKGRTPLEIAISKKNQNIINTLMENMADLTCAIKGHSLPLQMVYERFHFLIINQFDQNIKIVPDDSDPSNELLWRVKYNYRPIEGVRSMYDDDSNIRPTELLVEVLRMPTTKMAEVLTHPLSRLFMYDKSVAFQGWKLASIVFHAFFYVYTASVIAALAVLPTQYDTNNHGNSTTNHEVTRSAIQALGTILTPGTYSWWIFLGVYSISFILFFYKELLEVKLAPRTGYYWRQFENIGQWLLLPIVLVLAVWKLLPDSWQVSSSYIPTYFCTVGIFVSILLLQGQLTKTELCGIYNILLRKAVLRFLKFSMAFVLTYVAFSLVFNHLLHQERKWFEDTFAFGKTFIMFAGELDFQDTFQGDPPVSDYHRVLNAYVYFVFFVIALTIILQNILLALTVDDIQELKLNCLARHMAAELELIHILEGIQPQMSKFFTRISERMSSFATCSLSNFLASMIPKAPKNSEKDINAWIENDLDTFPENLQTSIKEYFRNKKSVKTQALLLKLLEQRSS